MPTLSTSPPAPIRYYLIDELRGLASLGVVFSHMVWLLPYPFTLLEIGRHGVEIFFVISGFVIAYSLRESSITPHFATQFFVRRSLRLDPPYWIMLILELFILIIWSEPLPSLKTTLLNIVYLQDLTKVTSIVYVAWTLCLEVQFYLVFILLLGLSQKISSATGLSSMFSRALLFGPLAIISLELGIPTTNSDGLFLPVWYMFFAGVLVCWTLMGKVSRNWLAGFLLIYGVTMGIKGVAPVFPQEGLSPILTALIICFLYWAGVTGFLLRGINIAWLRYLGKISYSLYLVHVGIGTNLIYWGEYRLGTRALIMFPLTLSAFMISLLAAHLLYIAVEKPSLEISRRMKKAES